MAKKAVILNGNVQVGAAQPVVMRAEFQFPRIPTSRPKMLLRPANAHIARQTAYGFRASFDAERPKSVDGSGWERIACDEVLFLRTNSQMHSHDITDSVIHCDPLNVLHTTTGDRSQKPSTSEIVFWLTPNKSLRPQGISTLSFDGSCEVRSVYTLDVALLEGIQLQFAKHYAWKSTSNHDKRESFLVLKGSLQYDAHDPAVVRSRLLDAVDDLLALLSLATERRVLCVGWQVGSENWFTSYYRGGISRPSGKEQPVLDQGLVPLAHLQQFIDTIWPRFRDSAFKDAIKAAIFATVPGNDTTVEQEYASTFSALEELLLVYRKSRGTEFILDESKQNALTDAFKNLVKEPSLAISKEQRSMLYDTFRGTSRIPLRYAIEAFVKEHDVKLDDLWPLTGSQHSLTNIRNMLVHGNFASDLLMSPLIVAAEHLKWTVYRTVLSLLGWPLEKTEASPRFLQAADATAYRQKDAMIKEFAEKARAGS